MSISKCTYIKYHESTADHNDGDVYFDDNDEKTQIMMIFTKIVIISTQINDDVYLDFN